jgi:hypothetical protein
MINGGIPQPLAKEAEPRTNKSPAIIRTAIPNTSHKTGTKTSMIICYSSKQNYFARFPAAPFLITDAARQGNCTF